MNDISQESGWEAEFDKKWEKKFGGINDKPFLEGQGKKELKLEMEGWAWTLEMQTFARNYIRTERRAAQREAIEALEKIAKWPEPVPGAGEGLGASAGGGMYIQYDADKKKHEAQVAEVIAKLDELK